VIARAAAALARCYHGGMDPQKKRARIARYKAKRVRLDMMVAPETLERFKNLPGLSPSLSYPERLAALMDCWEAQHRATDKEG
jgi:hypothetical protein